MNPMLWFDIDGNPITIQEADSLLADIGKRRDLSEVVTLGVHAGRVAARRRPRGEDCADRVGARVNGTAE